VTGDDVVSPIDLRSPVDAAEWERTAMEKRPWRADMFARIAEQLAGRTRVLELGSGPGFLAAHLLGRLELDYVALDVSAAMHELARARLGAAAARVTFVERDFLDPSWPNGLGAFDAVVTMQAVHELRHKSRAAALHAQVRGLVPRGVYLVCDHVLGELTNESLYMTEAEQLAALRAAGFADVTLVARVHGLALFAATG
jgi:SAM-dependent methyltransferase